MEGEVPEEICQRRFNELQEVLQPIVYEKSQEFYGKTVEILVEEKVRTKILT